MDFNPSNETSIHPIPRCSSAIYPSSFLDLYESTGETNGAPPPIIFTRVWNSMIRLHMHAIMNFDLADETSGSGIADLADEFVYVGSPEQIQRAMNFDPTDESSSLSRNSSAYSLPSSLDLSEQPILFDGQLPEPFDLETIWTNYWLPSYRVEYRPTIRREAPFNREEFSGWNQYSMLPVLGPQGETHWEAIQRLDREFLLWKRISLDAMQQNKNLKFRVQMLENSIVDLLVKNKHLEIRKNHSELEEMYLETTNNRVINQLKDKIAGLELTITQRELNRLTITTNQINFQMKNLEAMFTELKDEVNQFKVQFPNRITEVTRTTCVNELKDTINDFNRCRADVKHNIDLLISEICEFSGTVEDMEASDTVTELKMKANNLEMQIIHLFGRAYALKNGLVPLEKILEMEQNEASRVSTTGELFAQLWEDLKVFSKSFILSVIVPRGFQS